MSQVSIRVPDDLQGDIESWLQKNKEFNQSQLFLAAVRKFISEPQLLEPVTEMDEQQFSKLLKGVLKDHAHTLEKLK